MISQYMVPGKEEAKFMERDSNTLQTAHITSLPNCENLTSME